MKTIAIGYVPLTDSLPLFAMKHLGMDLAQEIQIELVRMGSWAQVRDALLSGQVHAAHCLAGIPLASQAGLYGQNSRLATAFTLNHYGNAITLSRKIFDARSSQSIAEQLKTVMHQRRELGHPLTLASVFPVSKHEFELRFWLQSLGLDPEHDLRLVVIPPPLIADSLRSERIDGFCVGEPWNSLAVHEQLGTVATTSRELDLPGTEKVLAVRESWLDSPEHRALIRGLSASTQWLGRAENSVSATQILANGLNLPSELLSPALVHSAPLSCLTKMSPFVQFDRINRPDRDHAAWLLKQIQEQQDNMPSLPSLSVCKRAFRTDIYDQATAV